VRFRELRTNGPSELCWQACLQEPPLAVPELQSFCMILTYIFLVRGTISSTQELGLHQIADVCILHMRLGIQCILFVYLELFGLFFRKAN